MVSKPVLKISIITDSDCKMEFPTSSDYAKLLLSLSLNLPNLSLRDVATDREIVIFRPFFGLGFERNKCLIAKIKEKSTSFSLTRFYCAA